MEISNKKVWLIVSKDRKVVAKGTPRNRELVYIDDLKDKKRYLTYNSKAKAESGFKTSFFSQWNLKSDKRYTEEDLEAVEVEMVLRIVS